MPVTEAIILIALPNISFQILMNICNVSGQYVGRPTTSRPRFSRSAGTVTRPIYGLSGVSCECWAMPIIVIWSSESIQIMFYVYLMSLMQDL